MVRVAVCDDDSNVTTYIHQYLEMKNKQLQNGTLHISLYHSGADFLLDVEKGIVFHIAFMDIQMDGLNGVEIGKRLRERANGDDLVIIYISSYDSYFEELLRVGSVLGFLRKPINEKELERIFDRALQQAIRYQTITTPRLFSFRIDAEAYSIRADEIVYMKNNKRIIELYTWNHTENAIRLASKFYAKIDDVVDRLPKDQFVRCERSYIVNLDYIRLMDKDTFTLRGKGATEIPISRRFKEEAKKAHIKHVERSVWMK